MLYVYYSNVNNVTVHSLRTSCLKYAALFSLSNKINLSQEEEFLVLGRVFLQ